MMKNIESICIANTSFNFEGQKSYYKGKVREVYGFDDKLVMIASDRISAFDHILNDGCLDPNRRPGDRRTPERNALSRQPHPDVLESANACTHRPALVHLPGHARQTPDGLPHPGCTERRTGFRGAVYITLAGLCVVGATVGPGIFDHCLAAREKRFS